MEIRTKQPKRPTGPPLDDCSSKLSLPRNGLFRQDLDHPGEYPSCGLVVRSELVLEAPLVLPITGDKPNPTPAEYLGFTSKTDPLVAAFDEKVDALPVSDAFLDDLRSLPGTDELRAAGIDCPAR